MHISENSEDGGAGVGGGELGTAAVLLEEKLKPSVIQAQGPVASKVLLKMTVSLGSRLQRWPRDIVASFLMCSWFFRGAWWSRGCFPAPPSPAQSSGLEQGDRTDVATFRPCSVSRVEMVLEEVVHFVQKGRPGWGSLGSWQSPHLLSRTAQWGGACPRSHGQTWAPLVLCV